MQMLPLLQLRIHALEFRMSHLRQFIDGLAADLQRATTQSEVDAMESLQALEERCTGLVRVINEGHSARILDLQHATHWLHALIAREGAQGTAAEGRAAAGELAGVPAAQAEVTALAGGGAGGAGGRAAPGPAPQASPSLPPRPRQGAETRPAAAPRQAPRPVLGPRPRAARGSARGRGPRAAASTCSLPEPCGERPPGLFEVQVEAEEAPAPPPPSALEVPRPFAAQRRAQ